jgi:hypothetical protein
MKKFTTCLLIAFSALLFIATGAPAQVTISGTVHTLDYLNGNLVSGPLQSGNIYAYDDNNIPQQFGPIANNGAFSLEVPENMRLKLRVKDIPNEDVVTHFPFITTGKYDLVDIILEVYKKNMIEYIISAYTNKGAISENDYPTSALLLGSLPWGMALPDVTYSGQGLMLSLLSGDPIFQNSPGRFVFLIKKDAPYPNNQSLVFPADVSVIPSPGGYAFRTEDANLYPIRQAEQSTYNITSVRLLVGREVSGTVSYAAEPEDEPLESGYISVLTEDDKKFDGNEIVIEDDGVFSLIGPRDTRFHMLLRGPEGGEFTWVNSPFAPLQFSLTDLELEILQKEVVEDVLDKFNAVFDDLEITEEDHPNIGLLGGAVERLSCNEEQLCDWVDAGGVSIKITNMQDEDIDDYYILYLGEDGWKDRGATTEDDGGFAILIRNPGSHLDVKVIAQRDDVENFNADPAEARVYPYTAKEDGIITLVPMRVTWSDPEPVDTPLDDGGGGGGCFIGTANSRR